MTCEDAQKGEEKESKGQLILVVQAIFWLMQLPEDHICHVCLTNLLCGFLSLSKMKQSVPWPYINPKLSNKPSATFEASFALSLGYMKYKFFLCQGII